MTTSGCFSYTLRKSICLAYVPTSLAALGNQVSVEMLGNRYPATIIKEPLIEIEAVRRRKAAKAKKEEAERKQAAAWKQYYECLYLNRCHEQTVYKLMQSSVTNYDRTVLCCCWSRNWAKSVPGRMNWWSRWHLLIYDLFLQSGCWRVGNECIVPFVTPPWSAADVLPHGRIKLIILELVIWRRVL